MPPDAEVLAKLRRIARCFSPHEAKALAVLQNHVKAGKIVCEDGGQIDLDDFVARHERAYRLRLRSGVPDEVRLLTMELRGARPSTPPIGAGTPHVVSDLAVYDGDYGIEDGVIARNRRLMDESGN